jgi:hypothetical protein
MIKYVMLLVFISGISNASVTPVWTSNGVSYNIAEQLSGVGLNSKANWGGKFKNRNESSNRTEDIKKVFNDGFKHFTYILATRYFFDRDCYDDQEFTVACIDKDLFKSKIEPIKQQMIEVISTDKDAVFVISLKPLYNKNDPPGGIKLTQFLQALEKTQETRNALYEIWKYIANTMSDVPSDNLVFNLMNEPEWERYKGRNTWEEPSLEARKEWEGIATKAVDIIRNISPNRTIIIEGIYKGLFNSNKGDGYSFGKKKYNSPAQLIIPIDRKNIVYGFHSYSPGKWVHQDSMHMLRGVKGRALPSMSRLRSDMQELVTYSNKYNIPVILSEVGVNGSCDGNGPLLEDRAKYASAVYETLIPNGVGITWWSLEDANTPYQRPEGRCYEQFYKDLIPEPQVFNALRLQQ